MSKITEFSAEYLGIDHPSYFQGVGVAFTDWDGVVCGIGDTPAEAFDDALEQLAMIGYDVDAIEQEESVKGGLSNRDTPSAMSEQRIDVSNEISPSDYGCEDFDEVKHDALVDERLEDCDEYPQCYVAIYYQEPAEQSKAA